MKNQRRTKNDMQHMNNDVRFYLLENSLNPHKAFEAMVKEHLLSSTMIPYYIKGVKDFINVSEELKQELGRNKQAEQEKADPIAKIKSITPEQYKSDIMPIFKAECADKDRQSVKFAIINLWDGITSGDYKHITNQDIMIYESLQII